MDSSIFSNSSKHPLFHVFLLFFLFSFFCLNLVSCTAKQLSYGEHCNPIVPESKPVDEVFNIVPFLGRQNGYYSGGDNVLNPNSSYQYYGPESKGLVFETHHVYATDAKDVFNIEGNLIFQSSYNYEQSFNYDRSYYSYSGSSNDRGLLDFDFQGFWSLTTGKLCMVGSSYLYSKDGKLLHLAALLQLNNLKNSSTINTLVTGTMNSLNPASEPNYFNQISLLMFPQVRYKYTKVSNQFSQGCPGGTDVPVKSSLSLSQTRPTCDMLFGGGNAFELVYPSGCNSSKSCNPFGDVIGYLPQFMSLSILQCSEDKQSMRILIEFFKNSYMGYYRSSNFSISLVGEGSWDSKKNQLCIVACRIYGASSSFEKSHVEDCNTRLSLRFPAILSIRNTSTVIGEIWSEKARNDPGFFNKIVFQSPSTHSGRRGIQLQGLKYEYKETDKVKKLKLCPPKKPSSKGKLEYPNGYSYDMQFHISIIKHDAFKARIGWGSADPLSVGDQLSQKFPFLTPAFSLRPLGSGAQSNTPGPLSISYKISISVPNVKLDPGLNPFNQSSDGYWQIQISAEGLYDAETGNLCMVGCRYLRRGNTAFSNDSVDCETLVEIQFPPLNFDRNGRNIKGSIKSMRRKGDPFYFRPLEISGRANYVYWASESIWRMDCETIMSVIANTLAIVFVALQIFYLRKYPSVSPFLSLLMLAILALGHLIPLVLNLEAMFIQDSQRSVWIRNGTWLEINEVIVRVVTMVAFLFQVRLLMLSWIARSSDEKKKVLWVAEKRGLYVCVPLYIVGGVIAFFVNWRKNVALIGRHSSYYREQIFLGSSRAYAGLILDGFLFPQIVFNMFRNSKEQALSRFFYIGITLVRLVPHGYDLYRARNYVDVENSYIYADPATDYYSTAWDLIIPVLGLFFAAIIHLQQRFGGSCFLPKRFQKSVAYEELQVASEEQLPLKPNA